MYPNGLPQFATPEQRAQFNVDEGYKPHMSISDLRRNLHETVADYNGRLRNTLLRIAKMHEVSAEKKDHIVLVVGHASTVDLAAGHLVKNSRESTEHDLTSSYKKIPVGSTLVLERVQGRRGWTPNLYAIPPVTYTGLSNQFSAAFVLRDAPVVKE
uniref:Phosphoglycerate mutase family protein n=1 Tax=Angiostrongylus cantonensis TaxID=6313 RepID=A0A0K0DN80_ANGCA